MRGKIVILTGKRAGNECILKRRDVTPKFFEPKAEPGVARRPSRSRRRTGAARSCETRRWMDNQAENSPPRIEGAKRILGVQGRQGNGLPSE
jgi:hypothetical protein